MSLFSVKPNRAKPKNTSSKMRLARFSAEAYFFTRNRHLERRAQMSNMQEAEWESELEGGALEAELEEEFHEGEDEASPEGEGWLGGIGNIAGSLLGESEDELEDESEWEAEDESEWEGAGLEGEGWLGTLGNIAGGLLGESEDELENEDETEEFFGSIGKFLKRAAPILKKVAKVAAPIVGTAVGGPFGAMLGKAASSALGEEEAVWEYEDESETEGEEEMTQEISSHELTNNEAVAEMMAESASQEQNESEAEAMAGAAAVSVISPKDRRALRRVLPHLVRGAAVLTRILRRRRSTRPAVRAVPTIVRRTVRDLKRRAASGKPVTRRAAGRAAAKQVRRVLGSRRA